MTSQIRIAFVLLMASLFAAAASAQEPLNIGANVNMVTGNAFPNGDPFLRQQNEPSVAFSSRNSLHLLSGANDYRAVDVPGLPGGRETGDSWLSYFWSTNGGATWKSTLIPGYPQDPDCQGPNPPTLCGYAAGADPVVRAGVNGMFYYSGIVFERGDPSRSAIFVSRFIDLNNDEGGDPIRFLDTTIIDANNDGAVFLDKSWIGVDIPRAATGTAITDTFSVTQRGGATVDQTVACGNIYVGYAAIGGEDTNLRSEIRLATSADCGNSWDIQSVSETDTLNQGANIAIHPDNGTLHVVWRRFDTVESFLGISPAGCPASPASWRKDSDWPVSSIDLAGTTYTEAEARNLLGRKHRGDESIKLSQNIIAAKLNLLTGGGDPAPGFNPWNWAQALTALVDEADAWLLENGLGSKPKQADKKEAKRLKREIQQLLQGSGTCVESDGGSNATFTGATNAIMAVSSDDFGETFSEPAVISESNTFDQGSTTFSFRTTAYPSVAADDSGRIYVAWAARGFATIRGDEAEGDARIVLSASTDGINWSAPYAIDEPNRQGHQIKPSMLFAGGQLTLVFYDFRQDVSNIFEGFVIDLPEENRLRHTVDVRVATALPAALPVFTDYSLLTGSNEPANPSSSASRYTFVATADGASGETLQVEYMVPNFPMFADGTTPFIGDYVDIAAPNLINDGGTWRFASQPGDVQVWQAVWSDNRDVIPPPDGDWGKYVAPITEAQTSFFDPEVVIPACTNVTFPDALPQFQAGALYTGTRNQNVYSASLSNGVIVAAPGNNRPLGFDDFGAPLERGFVVYVQNTTPQARSFDLSLPATPVGISASFAPDASLQQKTVQIPAYSSAVVTVFAAQDGTSSSEAIPVSVTEVGGTLTGSVLLNSDAAAPAPLATSLLTTEVHNPAILNPAILNPAILNASVDAADALICTDDPAKCVLNPAIFNPAIFNPAILNPAIFNPAILNPAIFNPAILNPAIFNPAIMNPAILNPAIMNPAILNPAILNPAIFNPAIFNPAILNPAILNPAIMNPAILNPAILNPAILNPAILNPAILNPAIMNPAILNTAPEPQQVDVTFAVRNGGNATTAYDLNMAAPQLDGLDYELLVYRLNEVPVADGCTLTTAAQQQLIINQSEPLNNPIDGSFYLEPGEEVLVTFRVLPDVEAEIPADPVTTFNVDDLGGLVSSQPLNTNPASQPPADEFGPPANIVLGSAGGTVIGAGGTQPLNAGPLTAGEQVSVTATGFVRIGPSAAFESTSPDGNGIPCNAACLLPGAPAGSLVGRIANGAWQLIGSGPSVLTAPIDGDLEFAINDNDYTDNSGSFYVSVTPFVSVAPELINADFESITGGGSFPVATDWNGNTQTALHSVFGPGNPGTPDLGLRFGFNGNSGTAASSQTTGGAFTANTAYTFSGWSTDSNLSVESSNIQFSIGYLDGGGVFQSLASSTYDTDGFTTWQELAGVTYTTGATGVELGQSITVQIQAVFPTFNEGVWFDNLELVAGPPSAPGFTVTSFDPAVVFSGTSVPQQAALNAAVGVTGYIIEDFEDATLVPELTLSGGAFGLNIASAFPNTIWDGASYYVDQVLTGGGVTFNIASGTNSFGIGLGDIDVDAVNLFVNGNDLGSIRALPNYNAFGGDNSRDVYIRVDADPGESITSVSVRQVSGSFSDGVFFDHVAIEPPGGPTPGTVWRADIDFTSVTPDGPYDCLRQQFSFNDLIAPGESFTLEIFDEQGGPAIASETFTSPFSNPINNVGFEVFLGGTALADGVGFELLTFSRPIDLDSLAMNGQTTCITGPTTPFITTPLTPDP